MHISRRKALAIGAATVFAGCGQSAQPANGATEAAAAGATAQATSAPGGAPMTIPTTSTQGGSLVGMVSPGAEVALGDATTIADAQGRFVVGFDRDAATSATLIVRAPGAAPSEHVINVAARAYDDQVISAQTGREIGDALFPRDWFDPSGEATEGELAAATLSTRGISAADQAKIASDAARKRTAFASREPSVAGFAEPWVAPVQGTRISSPWGSSRTVNTPQGRVRRTHYGIDIAAFSGRAIVAPAAAKVVLADPDLYYEGGCVFLDHGQGLITVYLHMNSVDVAEGDVVQAGQRIGAVGATGRATGPHLCWRMKWRSANLDPTLMLQGGTAALVPA